MNPIHPVFYVLWIRFLLSLGCLLNRLIPTKTLPVAPNPGSDEWVARLVEGMGEHLGVNRVCHSGYWDVEEAGLNNAASAMLDLICTRAGLRDGQSILDYGCGWGGLSLWIATRYPNSSIVAIAESLHQKRYIDQMANRLGIANVTCLVKGHARFQYSNRFDVAVSIDTFGMPGVTSAPAFRAVLTALKPGGHFFINLVGPLESTGGWLYRMPGLTRYLQGAMASEWLLKLLSETEMVTLIGMWEVDRRHYCRSIQAWACHLSYPSVVDKGKNSNQLETEHVRRWIGIHQFLFALGADSGWKIRQLRYTRV